MTNHRIRLTRRSFVKGAGALAVASMAPGLVRAQQGAPLQLGVLTPLTGAGGFDGPRMLKAMQSVIDEVNAAGGLLGRKVELVVEDDQTNPESAVRAARKLIDVTKVPAIMGTWASAVTTAVAPVCWESRTFPDHRLRRRFHYQAAASGLPHTHPAQQLPSGGQAR